MKRLLFAEYLILMVYNITIYLITPKGVTPSIYSWISGFGTAGFICVFIINHYEQRKRKK